MDFFAAHAHPYWLLFGLACFPRITLLFVGGPFAFLHWLGWVIAPHLLVAILATTRYWDTHPILCVIAWFFAFAGTSTETRAGRFWTRRSSRSDSAAPRASEGACATSAGAHP